MPTSGAALTTSRDVDMITFTGSTATDRQIMAAASETVKRVVLELGGKSAVIMLETPCTSLAIPFTVWRARCPAAIKTELSRWRAGEEERRA